MHARSRHTRASVHDTNTSGHDGREEAGPGCRSGKQPLEKATSKSHHAESSQQPNLDEAVKMFLADKQEEFQAFLQKSQESEKNAVDSLSPTRRESHYRSSDASSRRKNPRHRRASPSRHRTPRRTPSPPVRRDFGFATYGALKTPFSDEIVRTPMPPNYRTPSVTYDGLVDPQDFLGRYQYNMANQGLNEVHMCKLFPELLLGNARRWFDSLPHNSIRSYKDLMDAFHRRFFQKAEARSTSAQLLTVRQGHDEHVSDFMTRFHKECLQVDDLNDLLIISAFQNGLRPGALYRKLVESNPQTAREMWDIADQFSRADEADRLKRSLDSSSARDTKKPGHSDQGYTRRTPFERIQRGPVQDRLGRPRRTSFERNQRTPVQDRLGPPA